MKEIRSSHSATQLIVSGNVKKINSYLGIQHKLYCINQFGKWEFLYWYWQGTYTSGMYSFSPERLITKERYNGCWALYKVREWISYYQAKFYVKLNWLINSETLTAAFRPAAVVPAPPWCTWNDKEKNQGNGEWVDKLCSVKGKQVDLPMRRHRKFHTFQDIVMKNLLRESYQLVELVAT